MFDLTTRHVEFGGSRLFQKYSSGPAFKFAPQSQFHPLPAARPQGVIPCHVQHEKVVGMRRHKPHTPHRPRHTHTHPPGLAVVASRQVLTMAVGHFRPFHPATGLLPWCPGEHRKWPLPSLGIETLVVSSKVLCVSKPRAGVFSHVFRTVTHPSCLQTPTRLYTENQLFLPNA